MPPPIITTLASAGNEELILVTAQSNCRRGHGVHRISNAIVSFVDALSLPASFSPVPFRFGKAIRAQAFDIIRWLRLEQRLHEQVTNSRRAGNSMGIAASGHDEAFQAATLANNKPTIGGKGRPTFSDRFHF